MTSIRRPARTADRRAGQAATVYQFVGGKGGVGKTTCAAALALRSAASGRRTLVVSTDPAPSLGDAFARPLSGAPRRIPLARGSLHAVEIDAGRALRRWLSTRRDSLERVALRGTWLDADDVGRLLGLSLPGIDEMAALFEIARFGRDPRFDAIVVDTAPTGHTLRMLAMPETLVAIANLFDHMQAKYRAMVGALRGDWTPDGDDEMIAGIDRDARDLHALLRDPARLAMTWVTLPEPMAVAETIDAATALAAEGIGISAIIVNRTTPAPPSRCPWCDGRRVLEARAIVPLRTSVPVAPVTLVQAHDVEPRGVRALNRVAAELAHPHAPSVLSRRRVPAFVVAGPSKPRRAAATVATEKTRLLMFGGKGGVGKTTCAAAAALELARRWPDRHVLLLSTDPAHSLGDALGVALTDEAAVVRGAPRNLRARELDAARGLRTVRERYAAAIDGLFDRLARGGGLDATYDHVVMRELIELAPPGIDELAAVIEVTDALAEEGSSERFDLVVMDTAPSGHALRLLEMPGMVQDWAKALMSLLLKYQAVGGIGELGAVLLRLSRGLGRLRTLLADRERTRFVAVTRPAALPRAETVRLLRRLDAMHIAAPLIVMNAVGRGTCARCRRASAAETREIGLLARSVTRRGTSARRLIVAPSAVPPPHGPAPLSAWARLWCDRP